MVRTSTKFYRFFETVRLQLYQEGVEEAGSEANTFTIEPL